MQRNSFTAAELFTFTEAIFKRKPLFFPVITHCVKSTRIRSYSSPYGVSYRIQSECGKIRTRITPNTDTFYAVANPIM